MLPSIDCAVPNINMQSVDHSLFCVVDCWVGGIKIGTQMCQLNPSSGDVDDSPKRLPPPIWPHPNALPYHQRRFGRPGVIRRPSELMTWVSIGDFWPISISATLTCWKHGPQSSTGNEVGLLRPFDGHATSGDNYGGQRLLDGIRIGADEDGHDT